MKIKNSIKTKKYIIGIVVLLIVMGEMGSGYRSEAYRSQSINTAKMITINKTTPVADTSIYIKKYGATTNDRYIVFDVDTSLNTEANVIGIDFSGSNAFNNTNDKWINCDANNWWTSNGSFRASQYYIGIGNYKTYLSYSSLALLYSSNFVFMFDPTFKGDFIFRDGNYASGTINNDFFQIQDSAGTKQLALANKYIRGAHTFTALNTADTVVMVGVTASDYYFIQTKGSTPWTQPPSYVAKTDTLIVYCVEADTAKARAYGYNWLRMQ